MERRQSIICLLEVIRLTTKDLDAVVPIQGVRVSPRLANELHVAVAELTAQDIRYTCEDMMEKLPCEVRDYVLRYLLGTPRKRCHIPDMYQPHTELFRRNPIRLPIGVKYPQSIRVYDASQRNIDREEALEAEELYEPLPYPGHNRFPVYCFQSEVNTDVLQHNGYEDDRWHDFTDMELLGDPCHRELAKLWLRYAKFKLTPTAIQYLQDFLTRDIWRHKVPIVPYNHLRHITLSFELEVPLVADQLRAMTKQVSLIGALTQPTAEVDIYVTAKCMCLFRRIPVCDYPALASSVRAAIKRGVIWSKGPRIRETTREVIHPEVTNGLEIVTDSFLDQLRHSEEKRGACFEAWHWSQYGMELQESKLKPL